MMKRVFSLWLLLAAGLLLIMGAESCSNEEEKESEESNQNPAETELHKMYSSGVDLINPQQGEPNYSQALEIFKDAADKGDDSSMLATALLYEYGLGARQDLNSALEYYKKAAEQGSEVAKGKVRSLSNTDEQSKIVFPKESDYTYNEVYITSSNEGIQLVNGNATFVASGSCIKAMDGCGSPLYYSFNNVGHKSNVTLDSKETAASLLIAVLPYVLSEKVDDQTFDKFKNDVKALPLTQQLAKIIDECIVNSGFLNADVIAADYEQAVDELLNLLFEENSNIQSKTIRQSYDKVVPYAKSKAGESGFGGGGSVRVWGENDPPILVLGNDELSGQKISNQSVEFELKESKYDDVKDVWNCKFTITNSYNPFYIAVNKVKLPVTEETVLNGIETYDMLENVIGPFVAPDVLSLKGTWQYVSGSFEGLWDLVTKHELNDYYSPTKDYSIEFESEYDAIAVTSFDSNYPQLIVYYIVKDLAFPLIEKIIEDKITADPSDEYATEAIKALVTKLVLNDKVVKAVWKLKQMMVNGSSDEEVFYAFTSLWDEMLDVFKEYILDELKDGVTGVWIQNASGQMVLSEKGLGLYGTVEKTFGPGLSSVFGGITEARDAAASSLGVWVTAYKNARKAYKALQPLTGFSFKPFTVSVSPKCFRNNATPEEYPVLGSLSDGLVAYYPFDTDANDYSGNGNNGTATNLIHEAGIKGNAYKFAGVDNPGWIQIPNSSSLQFDEAASFSMWFNVDSYRGQDGWASTVNYGSLKLFSKDYDRGEIFGQVCGIDENKYHIGFWGICNNRDDCGMDIDGSILHKWCHAVFIATKNYLKVYLNGKLVDIKEYQSDFSAPNGNDLWIGRLNSYYAYYFNGLIDEFRVYDRVLNESEIKSLYCNKL